MANMRSQYNLPHQECFPVYFYVQHFCSSICKSSQRSFIWHTCDMLLLNVWFIKLLLYWVGDIMPGSLCLAISFMFQTTQSIYQSTSTQFKAWRDSATVLKLIMFEPILSTQIQRLNNRLTCHPFKMLLLLAIGRGPIVFLHQLSFVWEPFTVQKQDYRKIMFTQH